MKSVMSDHINWVVPAMNKCKNIIFATSRLPFIRTFVFLVSMHFHSPQV